MNENDFQIVRDEFGWKLINHHKLKTLSKDADMSDPFVHKRIWKQCHTHLKSHRMALVMRDNIIKGKIPKTRSERLLKSHIRISEDEKYIEVLKELVATRRKKGRQEYLNERREQSYYGLSGKFK